MYKCALTVKIVGNKVAFLVVESGEKLETLIICIYIRRIRCKVACFYIKYIGKVGNIIADIYNALIGKVAQSDRVVFRIVEQKAVFCDKAVFAFV